MDGIGMDTRMITAITLSFRMYHGFMVSHTGYLVDRVNVHVQT
jgi:hypothetical protein